MKVTVKLFATLRRGRFDVNTLDCPDGTRVQDIVRQLAIEEKDAAIIFLNSRHAGLSTTLGEGDTLAIFPPVGGG
ncbi:MAG TPA: MoaD/ThiS family protein [Deltaproteobacteria bacterium]|nr:MoaD/ThiS family protein [Deltaproteobacteria bacterium]